MRLLLDTHALLWWLTLSGRLNAVTYDLLADPANTVFVSIVSIWEIAIKARIGKLDADSEHIAESAKKDSFEILEISVDHLAPVKHLPPHHRDPFDHLLIAQAIAEGAVFVTNDRHAARYGVQTLACASPG